MSETEPTPPTSNTPTTTCCGMRRKVPLFPGSPLPESICGVSDAVMADYIRFDIEGPMNMHGRPMPVVQFRFCPWCGKPYTATSEIRITAIGPREPHPDV